MKVGEKGPAVVHETGTPSREQAIQGPPRMVAGDVIGGPPPSTRHIQPPSPPRSDSPSSTPRNSFDSVSSRGGINATRLSNEFGKFKYLAVNGDGALGSTNDPKQRVLRQEVYAGTKDHLAQNPNLSVKDLQQIKTNLTTVHEKRGAFARVQDFFGRLVGGTQRTKAYKDVMSTLDERIAQRRQLLMDKVGPYVPDAKQYLDALDAYYGNEPDHDAKINDMLKKVADLRAENERRLQAGEPLIGPETAADVGRDFSLATTPTGAQDLSEEFMTTTPARNTLFVNLLPDIALGLSSRDTDTYGSLVYIQVPEANNGPLQRWRANVSGFRAKVEGELPGSGMANWWAEAQKHGTQWNDGEYDLRGIKEGRVPTVSSQEWIRNNDGSLTRRLARSRPPDTDFQTANIPLDLRPVLGTAEAKNPRLQYLVTEILRNLGQKDEAAGEGKAGRDRAFDDLMKENAPGATPPQTYAQALGLDGSSNNIAELKSTVLRFLHDSDAANARMKYHFYTTPQTS